ncbi:chromosomal replication initiator protein DnaA [Leptospira kobayashii]|uniref:Chromosomal replication initiator protein DnaA n=1 Tax=Leptospira kobayashii TaxID=1917830 RepID=A0ABN6K8Y0_9LEPT|nr:chromosomal replication initiator protein DnaA [Leptospira kobayashii]BDA77071.1 chromosomal replication initiator protein DnaA [Leptospira kobayashii]
MEAVWEEILEEVSKQIPPKYFRNFIAPLHFVRWEGNDLVVSAPSQIIKSHVEAKYINFIETAAYQVKGDSFRLVLLTDKEESTLHMKSVIENKFQTDETELNSEYNFETYIVSDCNKLAFTAAKSISENPGKYNPLYLFGPVGVGKTHLLHAIGSEIKKKDPWKTVRYVDSISFLNEFIFTVRQNNRDSLESFKMRYQSYNVLLFDDIQFLNGGAEKTQEEFFALFNFLYERKRQIVIASDRPSYELPLHDRLKSRFVHGLQADIKEHDQTLRKELLRTYSVQYNIPMSEETLDWLAVNCEGDSRALIGIINDLVLYKKAYQFFLLPEDKIREIANSRLQTNRKRIGFNPDQVIDLICERMSVARKDLLGKSRKADYILPRHLSMLLLHEILGLPKSQIGRIFSAQHTTVIHGINKIKERFNEDQNLADLYQSIKHQISFQ